jgi:hypothetical protein
LRGIDRCGPPWFDWFSEWRVLKPRSGVNYLGRVWRISRNQYNDAVTSP